MILSVSLKRKQASDIFALFLTDLGFSGKLLKFLPPFVFFHLTFYRKKTSATVEALNQLGDVECILC